MINKVYAGYIIFIFSYCIHDSNKIVRKFENLNLPEYKSFKKLVKSPIFRVFFIEILFRLVVQILAQRIYLVGFTEMLLVSRVTVSISLLLLFSILVIDAFQNSQLNGHA